ncbi:MAG TPA: DnaJ C-terminal domain-containing protein [Pirellulales bacterium]|nr:DnaJ C-terminal domain-containing protein [Pirellulales bacterium]
MAEDYYKTLGLSRDASQADIDKAYAKLARKYHPDVNPDDKTAKKKFQAVQAAYDVLKDPSKREMYNRYGSSFEQMGGGGPQPGPQWRAAGAGPGGAEFDFSQLFGGEGAGGFADLFGQFRRGAPGGPGRRGRAAGRAPGADLHSEVQIPFNLAVTGGETHLSISRPSGQVETLSVKIPKGIEDGKKIRLRGQGEAGAGGARGDILLTVRVAAHPWFTRRGEHLYVRVPVSLREAAEGATVDVPTPQGTVALRIPPGVSSGKKLRIKGHGVAASGKPAGDLFAELQVVLPAKLDEASLEAIRQIDAKHPVHPRRELRW